MKRRPCLKNWALAISMFVLFGFVQSDAQSAARKSQHRLPNIVVILADDMGYGEVQCLNPQRGKIKTPQLDAIAAGGMIFTDAHSGSSVCTPTRYGVMTGRYAWRTRLQNGVLTGGKSLIAKERLTLADMLGQQGYHTAMFGKWHLGMLFNGKKEVGEVPIGTKVTDGPIDAGGFDEFHGFHHSRQMKVWIDNGTVTEHIEPVEMLPKLAAGAVDYINGRKGKKEPFFLYVPWNSPHSPVVPSAKWQGKSGLNAHADFVMQTDDSYGQVIQALRDNDMLDHTLVICSCDNGTSAPTAKKSDLEARGHFPSGDLRGSKADIWDGGHRVPFIAHWPNSIKAGSRSAWLVCLTDIMATVAQIVGFKLPPNAAEDSLSFLPALRGEDKHARTSVIHHSIPGYFAIRQDKYKLIMCPGSGGWTAPKPNASLWKTQEAKGKPTVQLYDMAQDLGEQANLAAEMPEKVKALRRLLKKQVDDGRSTPGPKQANDASIVINKRPGSKKSSKRPNVLFILADDQSPLDLRMYNPASILDTPVLDQLASEGMVFDGAYHMGSWSGAVCTPSRHMIMSGRTVWHIPGRGNLNAANPKMVPVDLPENTMAAIFNRAGYATMRTCKRGNSYAAANEKFSVRHDSSKRGSTDETGSAWHAEQVLNYLKDRQTSKDTRPFMIYYGFSHPHDPRNGKVDLLAKYGAVNHTDKNVPPPANPKQPALPVNYLPAHPFHHGHPGLRDEVKVSGVWKKRDERTIRNEMGREFACSENIDIQIGRVLKKLKAMGELDNTYIFYTADHGIAIGRHGLQGKQNLYEHTWRVPFIVKGPGIRAGSRVQGNIYLLDTLGTLCDLTGIRAPKTVEGKSFKPVLQGKQTVIRDVLYGVYCGGTKPGMRSVRKGDWKLIKCDVMDGRVRQTQLFNLKDNPHEFLLEHQDKPVVELTENTATSTQVNLANDPKYAAKRTEMEALLLSEMRRLNDPYRLWDQPDDGLAAPRGKAREKKRQ
jgi:choline-sulfatase